MPTPTHACLLLVLVICSFCGGFDSTIVRSRGDTLFQYTVETRGAFGRRLSYMVSVRDSILRTTRTYFDYPVYRFDVCDIDADGVIDVCLGVTKRTRFDSRIRNRLFLYTFRGGFIHPLWLGSRVGQGLVDFRIVEHDRRPGVRTFECHKDSTWAVGLYRWRYFGLEWISYLRNGVSYDEARRAFNN